MLANAPQQAYHRARESATTLQTGPRLGRYIGQHARADSDANHAGFASRDEDYIALPSILQFSGPDSVGPGLIGAPPTLSMVIADT
jgi:hypothetical protein